jgi:hypothetical protein
MRSTIAAVVCLVAVAAIAADELQLSVGWVYNKDGRKRTLSPVTALYDVSGGGVIENVQTITTNGPATALVLGSVTAPGFAYFKNLDATNAVRIGTSDGTNFTAFLRLRAGESSPTWLDGAVPYALAVSNSVRLDYTIADR